MVCILITPIIEMVWPLQRILVVGVLVQTVKETPRIVPHCHPVPLEGTEVNWRWNNNDLWCTVSVSAHYKTGIEMEALTGVAAGLLCAFDMVKSLEKDEHGQYPVARITDLEVVEKFKGN